MIDLLIDAPLLACPSDDLEDDEFNEAFLIFVTALADLSRFRRSLSSSKIWREASLASTLYTINAYPFRHALAQAFTRLDPELGFQLEDISGLATALLSKSNCINDLSSLEDIVIDQCNIANDPCANRGPELIEYVCRATEFAFCHLGEAKALPSSVRVASRPLENKALLPVLRYQLNMASYRDGTMLCPEIFREIELECFCGNEFTLRNLDPALIWINADEASLTDAIAIFAANQGDTPYDGLPEFRRNIKIGNSFLTSCRGLGFLHETAKIRRLISACVDIRVGRNLNESHWLREGMGANESQKKREDGYAAWRHDVDDEFHLHYWKKGAAIEFANVVVHNNFSIT